MTNPNHSPDLPRCGAKTRAGTPCEILPMKGATRCRLHGGSSPQAKAKAAGRVREAAARAVMARRGLPEPVAISHREALTWLVSAKYAEVVWLRGMVQAIPEADLVWGVTRERAGNPPSSPVGGTEPGADTPEPPAAPERTYEARVNIWLGLLHEAERDLAARAKDAHSVGIDDANLDLAKERGRLLGVLVDGLLGALCAALVAAGVTGPRFEAAWQVAVEDLLPKHFRAMGGAA